MSRRALWVGLTVAAVAVVAVAAYVARDQGTFGPRVEVGAASAAGLDTIAVAGREVRASLDGVVAQVDAPDRLWLVAGGDAFPLRFEVPHGLAVEDRVLAAGRVRAWRGRRWLAVEAWSHVVAAVEPPAGVVGPPGP